MECNSFNTRETESNGMEKTKKGRTEGGLSKGNEYKLNKLQVNAKLMSGNQQGDYLGYFDVQVTRAS